MVKCPSYVKEIFLQLFFWNQYLNQAHRFPLADMAFRSPFVSNSTSSFLFPHWCLLSEVVIWRICSINGRWVKFPPYAKDKKPTYGSGDTFQVLSEKNKKNIFFFQEEINTINSYRGNAAWHGEEMTKSKLRLFNTGIKDCCGNRPYYLRAFFRSGILWNLSLDMYLDDHHGIMTHRIPILC